MAIYVFSVFLCGLLKKLHYACFTKEAKGFLKKLRYACFLKKLRFACFATLALFARNDGDGIDCHDFTKETALRLFSKETALRLFSKETSLRLFSKETSLRLFCRTSLATCLQLQNPPTKTPNPKKPHKLLPKLPQSLQNQLPIYIISYIHTTDSARQDKRDFPTL